MEKKNQPCYNKKGELIGWLSPSIAIVTFVFLKSSEGNIYVLATRRGIGCPDNKGKWNCQCGYLDFGESTTEAAIREVLEETGIALRKDEITDWKWIDVPDENGNIVHRFYAVLEGWPDEYPTNENYSEQDEVEDIAWIPLDDVHNYQWAFGHETAIQEALQLIG